LDPMSTGIGRAQRRILDELSTSKNGKLAVVELATRLGLRDNQVRRAVHSLAQRGRVVLDKKHGGWAGVGEYGPLRRRADDGCARIGMPTGISLFVALPKTPPIPPAIIPVSYQRIIRDRHREQDPRPPLPSIHGCVVEAISRAEAEPFILRRSGWARRGATAPPPTDSARPTVN
jgi:hypothetical protein